MSDTPMPFKEQLAVVVDQINHNQWTEALSLLVGLKHQYPGHAHVLHLYGMACHMTGDLKGALEAVSQAVAFNPVEPDFQLALGLMLKQKGAIIPAKERLQETIRLNPDFAIAHFHLGDILMDLSQVDDATHHFQQALALNPHFSEAWINLGLCQKSKKLLPEAKASFQEAIRVEPDNAKAHINLALTHLIMGEYSLGWQEYEWRFKLHPDQTMLHPAPPHLPRWQGESLVNKTILVIGEQGYGDTLQFVRFLLSVKQSGAKRVLLTVPTPLLTLLQQAPGVDLLQNHTHFAEPIDYYIPLLSIPGLLGVTEETIPFANGYLIPDPKLVDAWRLIKNKPEFKVGLVWEGKPLHQNDPLRRRSCTLANLAPLAQVPGVAFFSLQKGEPNHQTHKPPPGMRLYSMDEQLTDFATTAAVMANLDLIITIDTATAHLAGALGKPVWTLLPMAPDWRWGISQETTPWYASMRLFRQTVPNQWEAPMEEMTRALSLAVFNHPSDPLAAIPIPDLINMAVQQLQLKNHVAVSALARRILTVDPDNGDAFYLLGLSANIMEQPDLALNLLDKAIARNPNQPYYHFNKGSILTALKRLPKAKQSLLTAIQLKPDFAEAHVNLGSLFFEMGEHRTAAECYLHAISLDPNLASGYHNFGVLLQEYNDHVNAIEQFQLAVRCTPNAANSHMGLAHSLLKTGNFAAGWQEYEWRCQLPNHQARICPVPRWDGSLLQDKRIYVYTEQGFGDALMFVRYTALLKAMGAMVLLECRPELFSLFKASDVADQVTLRKPGDEQPPPFDYDLHIPLMSLPFLLGTTQETIPCHVPYLTPDPERVQAWADRFGPRQGVRVGIVWSGNPNIPVNRNRACTLQDLLPLMTVPNVTFYSLQKGPPAVQLTETISQWHEITSLDVELTDFCETAAALLNLDLLISTDTAIVHLAGGLGIKVWTLLHIACEWRWLEAGQECPWYPSMRLFRQQTMGDWQELVNRVRRELADWSWRAQEKL